MQAVSPSDHSTLGIFDKVLISWTEESVLVTLNDNTTTTTILNSIIFIVKLSASGYLKT